MTNKKIKISSRGRLGGHRERKINLIEKDSINTIRNSNLISSTNSFKIIGSEYLSPEKIERLEALENSQLVKSIRKAKISLNKSYSNEFGYAYKVM
jgi:hypothetical protein